jgi:Ca2+:H+ antiporter
MTTLQEASEPVVSGSVAHDPETAIGDSNSPTEKTGNHGQIRGPRYNHNGHLVTRGIHPDGESGRKGVHPWRFLKIAFRSSSIASKFVNILWPFVPAAIAVHFAKPDAHYWVFALNYIAMVPTANLIGFAGQELARKLPTVFGKNTRFNCASYLAPLTRLRSAS